MISRVAFCRFCSIAVILCFICDGIVPCPVFALAPRSRLTAKSSEGKGSAGANSGIGWVMQKLRGLLGGTSEQEEVESSSAEAPIVVQEWNDPNLMHSIFHFLAQAGMEMVEVQAHREIFDMDPQKYLRLKKVFVARSGSAGEILGVCILNRNPNKMLLMHTFGFTPELPEPIGMLDALQSRAGVQHRRAEVSLLQHAQEYFEKNDYLIMATANATGEKREVFVSQGFRQNGKWKGAMVKRIGLAAVPPGMPEPVKGAPYDLEEITDMREIPLVFELLIQAGFYPESVEHVSEGLFKPDREQFMREFRTFVARDRTTRRMLGAIMLNPDISKTLLDKMLEYTSAYSQRVGYINMIGVLEPLQGAGMGEALLQKAEDVLRESGITTAIGKDVAGFLSAHRYVSDPVSPKFVVKHLGVSASALEAEMRQVQEPLEILNMIHTRSEVRELVDQLHPPENALQGLRKKMEAKPREAAERLKRAVPGIEALFPGLDNPTLPARGSKRNASLSAQPVSPQQQRVNEAFLKSYRESLASNLEGAQYLGYALQEGDRNVFKLYYLAHLARTLAGTQRERALTHAVEQGAIRASEQEAVMKAVEEPPQAALTRLIGVSPGATLESAQNAYIRWLKWIWDSRKFTVRAVHEYLRALDEGKVHFTYEGKRIPFAIFTVQHSETMGFLLDNMARSAPVYAVFTASDVRQGAERDVRTTAEDLLAGKEADIGPRHFVEAIISGHEAPLILPHIDFPEKDATILEINGSGAFLKEVYLAQRSRSQGAGVRYAVVEEQPNTADFARKLRRSEGLQSFEVYTADPAKMTKLKSGSVRAVFAQGFFGDLHFRRIHRKMIDVILEIDRVLEKGGMVHVIDDGNTPVFVFALFSAAGYEVVKKQVIPQLREYGDSLLLSLRKKYDHDFAERTVPQLASEELPRALRRLNDDSQGDAQIEKIIREQWAMIPQSPSHPGADSLQADLGGQAAAGSAL